MKLLQANAFESIQCKKNLDYFASLCTLNRAPVRGCILRQGCILCHNTWDKTKAGQQPLITAAFKQPLPAQSDRVKAITNAIGVFIATDMRPYSVVQTRALKTCWKCLSHVTISHRAHTSFLVHCYILKEGDMPIYCTLSCFSLIIMLKRRYYAVCTTFIYFNSTI